MDKRGNISIIPNFPYHGIATDENHGMAKWERDGKTVYFSFTQRGKLLLCHFSAGKESLRHVRDACKDFAFWVKENSDFRFIAANSSRRSATKIIESIGFTYLTDTDTGELYILDIRGNT